MDNNIEELRGYKFALSLNITKPDAKGRRDVYGKVTARGDSEEDFVKSIQFAVGELLKQLEN